MITLTMFVSFVKAETVPNIVGGDISLLPSYESYNTPYYDQNGKKITDVITYLKETCGWNAVRVRLFVNPKETGTKNTGVEQDLEYVVKLGKRVKDAGMYFMLDFHYSDSWADPTSQTIPSRWPSNNDTALADSVYQYTKNCLNVLKSKGATPDYIQIGNEISYGMLWRNTNDKVYPSQAKTNNSSGWSRLETFLGKGSKAVREVCPNAKIIIHTERTGNSDHTVNYYSYLSNVDYDIIGLSYYPFWHGIISVLNKTLSALESNFPSKKVQIVETGYYYQYMPSTSSTFNNTSSYWAESEAGQKSFISDLISELKSHSNVNALYYWFPEENGNGGASWNANTIVISDWVNRGLWNASTHKAHSGLYEMKNYRNDLSSVNKIIDDASDNSQIYNILGQKVKEVRRGEIYIKNGKKYIQK